MSYQVFIETAPPVDSPTDPPDWVSLNTYALNEITINYGREKVDTDVDASTFTAQFLLDSSLGAFPFEDFDLGYMIRIYVVFDGETTKRIRFLGNVTDTTINRDTMSIAGVTSVISRYGKFVLGSDIIRSRTKAGVYLGVIAALAEKAKSKSGQSGSTADNFAPGLFDLDGVKFVKGDNALAALQLVAQSEPFGFLWEDFFTQGLRSNDQSTREKVDPDFILTGDEIIDDWEVSKSVLSQVTSAVVNYSGSAGAASITYEIDNPLGDIQVQYDTLIYYQADAELYGLYRVGRGTELRYEIPKITIPIGILPEARQKELISTSSTTGLRMNSFVRIPEIRPYIQTDYFVEGWTETIARHRWDLTLRMSDIYRSRYFQRWSRLDAALQWEDVEATKTWADLYYDWI